MVFNATFNTISAISWRPVLLVEETGENQRSAASHWQTLSHNVEYTSLWAWFELITFVLIGTDCTGIWKSNYHTITTTPHALYNRMKENYIYIYLKRKPNICLTRWIYCYVFVGDSGCSIFSFIVQYLVLHDLSSVFWSLHCEKILKIPNG